MALTQGLRSDCCSTPGTQVFRFSAAESLSVLKEDYFLPKNDLILECSYLENKFHLDGSNWET